MLRYVLVVLAIGFVQANPGLKEDAVGFLEDIKLRTDRVTGGWPAQDGQFPYQVSIRMISNVGNMITCGGSIVDNEWIITSAHCLANRISYLVRLGTIDIRRPLYMIEQDYRDAVYHPEFDTGNSNRVQQHDVALLKLSIKVAYGPTIQPVRIQNTQQIYTNYENRVLTVSGFGYHDDSWNGGTDSDIMLWTHLVGLSNEYCLNYYTRVYETTLCARYYNSTDQSACYGDSGGPLTIKDEDGKDTMVGIVHYGSWRGCTSPWPTAYVRPGFYHQWLTSVTGINFDWSF
ncbi:collagenase-like [Melitaea cinxia]|uniref:collagenase-like n=1 Tax=Melitaea cinxia TaxID=113334 RepID=UPI001E26F90F|nr:collagenase-like [Melitaea cinxia]